MRISAKTVAIATVLLLLGLTTGCSEEEPNGVPPTSTPTEGQAPGPGAAPKVTTPIDPSPFVADPCKLVPTTALAELGRFDPGEPDVDSDEAKNLLGPGCGWLSADIGGPSVSLRIGLPRRDAAQEGFKGMESIYRAKESGDIDHLQPLQIPDHPDYPAAVNGLAADIAAGKCGIDVGMADDLTYAVNVIDEENPANACQLANKVAGIVLESMLKGA